MRILAVAAKRAPSINLLPRKKKQILVDGDIADVIKRVAGALGYLSMSGLLNDALVHYLKAEYPHLQLIFAPRSEAEAQERPEAEPNGTWIADGEPADDDPLTATEKRNEQRQAKRRQEPKALPNGAERRTKSDRRKG